MENLACCYSTCLTIRSTAHTEAQNRSLLTAFAGWAVPASCRALHVVSPTTLVFTITEVKLVQGHGALVLPAAPFSGEHNTRSPQTAQAEKEASPFVD